jgi:hypothetical protein
MSKWKLALGCMISLLCYACEKDMDTPRTVIVHRSWRDTTYCIYVRNSFDGAADQSVNPTLAWGVCTPRNSYKVRLSLRDHNGVYHAYDSLTTTDTIVAWPIVLPFKSYFKWNVTSDTLISATDSFSTQGPDQTLVGRYRVAVGYSWYSPAGRGDTVYGYTTIRVSQASDGYLRFDDDSILNVHFNAYYNDFVSINQGNYTYAIRYPDQYMSFSPGGSDIDAGMVTYCASCNYTKYWRGTKIP